MSKKRTNWHEAAVCAIQITLRDYESLLEYISEFTICKGALRIDLLVIRKLPEIPIPHSIARIFRTYNLFEIKGVHSSVSIKAYYKTIAYASLLIAEEKENTPDSRQQVSISFLCKRYPRKLIRYLTEECKKTIANEFPGVYYINEEMFSMQIIVTGELPQQEALYLHCLTDQLNDTDLIERLVEDYSRHQDVAAYEKYMDQLTNANMKQEGESPMCCEGIFRLYGTSSKEIARKAAEQQALADAAILDKTTSELDKTTLELDKTTSELDKTTLELDKTTSELDKTTLELDKASTEIDRLKELLKKHHIAYE